MINNELTCIIKKSVANEYGLFAMKEAGQFSIKWERAMTTKEAIKKIERLQNVDAVIIEDAKERDTDEVNALVASGVKVILLCGDILCNGAVRVFNTEDVIAQLLHEDSAVESGVVEEIENNDSLEEAVMEDISSTEDANRSEHNIMFNGIEPAKYEEAVREKNMWRSVAENAKHELSIMQETMERLLVDESVIEYMSSGIDGRELQRQVELLENDKKRLEETLKSLGGERGLRRDAEDKLERAENDITSLQISLMDERTASEVLREVLMRLTYYGRELMEQLAETQNNLTVTRAEKADALDTGEKLRNELGAALKKVAELEQQIGDLLEKLEDIKESNEELSGDIILLEGDKKNLTAQLEEARLKIERAGEEKEHDLDNLEEKEKELARLKAYNIEEMKNKLEQYEHMAREYESMLAEASVKEDALNKTVLELKQKVTSYKEMADAANNRLHARERVYNGDTFSAIDVNYIGRAILVAVAGSGGYGTTTVACALAESLCASGNNVAIVDLDMRSPKMDAYYNVNPFRLDVLGSQMQSEDRKTSVGALIKLGADFWIENHEALGIDMNAKGRKDEGRLVYHSGSYASLSATEMSGANYSAMLRELGIEFDYIIVDLGRLESSGSVASVQVGAIKASNQAFFVTNSTFADVRSMRSRTINAKMKLNNVCWVLNMVDGRVDTNTMNIADDAESVVQMPMIRGSYGTTFSLYENKKSSGQVQLMASNIR